MKDVPMCPKCGERNRVKRFADKEAVTDGSDYWCERCCGWLSNLCPDPGKVCPEDIGPPPKRKRYRKGATPRLTGEAQERGTPLGKGRTR